MDKKLILEVTECAGFKQAYINDLRISKNKPMSESKTIIKLELDHDYLLQALGAALGGTISVGVKWER